MMITPSDFLTFLYDDERGYIEIVAGRTNSDDPKKIKLDMPTRKWCAYPDALDQATAYIEQLTNSHGNVYIGVRLYDERAKVENTRKEEYTRPSKIIFIDDAPEEPYLFYSASIRTSEHSRHGYYKADASTVKSDARRAAKYLGGDPSGVDLTQLVRVVGTFNTKNGGRFPVVIEDVGPVYKLDDLRSKFPPVEAEKGKGTIEALDWPEVEAHLSNIDALLGSARAQLIKPTTQTGRILGGEMIAFPVNGKVDDSRSMNACAVAHGLLLRGFPDDEIAAVLIHLYRKWGSVSDKGTAWVKLDAGRCIADAHAYAAEVKQSPTHYRKTAKAEPIAEVKPISRARADRPQRFTAAALYLEYQRRPDLCDLKRKARAASLEISTATLDRLEDILEKEELISIFTDPRRQGSRVILRGVINISAAEVLSAAPAPTPAETQNARSQSGQTTIEQPQCIGETPAAPETPGPAAPTLTARELVAEAFDYLATGGARLSFSRVRRYVEDNAGRPMHPAAIATAYNRERDKRQRDRTWQRQIARLPTMKIGRLTALDKRTQAILADGPGARMYRWASAIYPHISAELERRAEMRDRLRTGPRPTRTVEHALLFAEIEDQIADYRASTKRRKGPIAQAARLPSAGGVPPCPATAPPDAAAMIANLMRAKAERSALGAGHD